MSARRSRSFQIVTQYFPPEQGAAQVRLGSLAAALVEAGNQVEVVTALPNYPLGRIFDGWPHRLRSRGTTDGLPTVRVWVYASMGTGVKRMANYLSFSVTSLVGMVGTRRADWTLVEYPTLFGALPAVAWSRLRRRKVMVILADLWVDSIVEIGVLGDGWIVGALRAAEGWMLRTATAVTAVTVGMRDGVIAQGVAAERVAWLPNGVDVDLFHPGPDDAEVRRQLGVPDGHRMLLYAGTHGHVHGLDVVLDAAVALRDDPVTFVLVGDGSEKADLVRRAGELGLDNVVFHDPVSPAEVARYLRGALAGLATVRRGDIYDTVRSAKMMPIMASGRPVLYSAADEGARLVASVGSGIVTPPEDVDALVGAIRALVADPAEADRLGAIGRRWTCDHASWRSLVADWLVDLDRLEHGRAPVAADGRAPVAAGPEGPAEVVA